MSPDPAAAYLRWSFTRAALVRGWWLVTGLHLVVDARLGAAQLILIGVFQAVTVVVAEVPAGVLADTVSRRSSLVASHVVRGAGMAMAGLVGGFPLLVVSQCLWGLGWALSSGADVAWITDELDDPDRIDRVLVAEARRVLLGTVVGLVGAGLLAAVTGREVVIVGAGVASVAQGLAVARWPERGFVPIATGHRWREAAATLGRGVTHARADPVVMAVLVATALVNGGVEGYGRPLDRRLLALGLPTAPDPVVWLTALAVATAAVGAVVLRAVEARIAGVDGASRAYAAAGGLGAVVILGFAAAPGAAWAAAGALIVGGIAFPIVRVAATVIVNRRTESAVRATVHSLLSQAENAGELAFGLVLAGIAGHDTATLTASAALVGAAAVVVSRGCRRSGRRDGGTPPG